MSKHYRVVHKTFNGVMDRIVVAEAVIECDQLVVNADGSLVFQDFHTVADAVLKVIPAGGYVDCDLVEKPEEKSVLVP